jgi:amidase
MTHQENELSTAQATAHRTTAFEINDHVGAFVPHGRFTLPGAASGPLAGLRFAAKDLFDVAGHPTGAGNPTGCAAIPSPRAAMRWWTNCCRPVPPWPARP